MTHPRRFLSPCETTPILEYLDVTLRPLRPRPHACMYTYLFTGHTHQADDRRQGRTRLINPGAVHRSATPSLAVLDLATDALEHMAL